MNLTLFLIGTWFSISFFLIFCFAILLGKKDTSKYGNTIIIISALISGAITFLIGGIIGGIRG